MHMIEEGGIKRDPETEVPGPRVSLPDPERTGNWRAERMVCREKTGPQWWRSGV